MKPVQISKKSWLKYNLLFIAEHFLGEKLYKKLFLKTENKLITQIEKEIINNPVSEEDSFKLVEFQENEIPEPFLDNFSPMVFRGAAKKWPSYEKWTFDFFSETFGDEEITLINNEGLIKDTDQAYDTLKFSEYISNLRKGSKDYLKFSRILETKSFLIDDFDYKWLRKFRTKNAANDLFYFFMGGKSTMTPIHNGYAHTLFVQIQGQKKWTFYPASDRMFIGVRSRRFNYFYTDADSSNVNDPKFPLLKYAQPVTVTINPGDVLYFPSLMWHQVENVSDSIGVAYKFADFLDGMRVSKTMATLFFLSTKPTILNTIFPNLPDPFNFSKKVVSKADKKKLKYS